MISYNSSDVVQCLRQYDMFANSLNLIKDEAQRGMIIKQLTKLEEKIIALTNEIYEEEYNTLLATECSLFDDEKRRLNSLVELINQRLSYVEKRCNNHYQLTGISINVNDVLGADKLDSFENKIKIIDRYLSNVKLEKELEEDIKSLTSKIALASEKVDINRSLNVELESTFKEVLHNAFTDLELFSLADEKDDISSAYYEIEKSLSLAKLNYETAKNQHLDIVSECKEMLDEISSDYLMYRDKISIIKLIEMYDREVSGYDELVSKREEVNDILKGIRNQKLLNLISDTISKQYSTITMEVQDINTLNDLTLEKERKSDKLAAIRSENESEEFKSVLDVLIENEKKKQEKLLAEKKKIEEEEKQKKLEIERKKQEEVLKRQRIIEQARKKDMEKRTKQLLEEQQNSVLQGKKKPSKMSFENIKDVSLNDKIEEATLEKDKVSDTIDGGKVSDTGISNSLNESSDVPEKEVLFKNKVDIEKELFDEFNSSFKEKSDDDSKDISDDDEKELFDKIDEKFSNNKFPDMSIDEYMKNFDETKLDKNDTLSDFDDDFPSIPV